MELFAWLKGCAPVRFLLCVDKLKPRKSNPEKLNPEKLNSERAIDRDHHHGFSFYTADDGESILAYLIFYIRATEGIPIALHQTHTG